MVTRFECSIPILRVRNLQASLKFYEEILGFSRDWGGDSVEALIASVSRDGCPIMLFQEGQGQPGTWIWIGVEDIEPLHADYVARGVKVILPPTNFYFAREMRIEDPDGHILRIGSESRPDLPISTPPD